MTSPIIIRAAVASLPEATVRKLVESLVSEEPDLVAEHLAPVLEGEPSSGEPAEVVDRDGDRWTRQADGRFQHGSMEPRTLERLREDYGPITLGTPA